MERQEETFRELNERFIKELVLIAPDLDKNENGSKYIRLYNRRSTVYGI